MGLPASLYEGPDPLLVQKGVRMPDTKSKRRHVMIKFRGFLIVTKGFLGIVYLFIKILKLCMDCLR